MKSAQYYLDKCSDIYDCKIWTGAKSGYGYPVANIDGRNTLTYLHRYIHETFNGIIPNGYVVDHKCNIPSCLNPEHLQAITPALNKTKEGTAGRPSKLDITEVAACLVLGLSQKVMAKKLGVDSSTISKFIKRNF